MRRLEARQILRDHGMVLTSFDGEYRVNFEDGDEATAYYTTDLFDAVDTGVAMAEDLNESMESTFEDDPMGKEDF